MEKFHQQEGANGPYVLRLTNGDRAGQRRESGVTIRINDVILDGVRQLTADVEFLEIPIAVTLADENEIEAVVTGAADAQVTVVIATAAQ